MKSHKAFLQGVLVTALAFSLFQAGTVYATTNCFPDTNGHWAETFICWLKDNGIAGGYPNGTFGPENPITRAEMAIMLQRAANLPPPGEIRVNVGPNGWAPFGGYGGIMNQIPLGGRQEFTVGVQNHTDAVLLTPDFPSALYGRNMSVTGLEYCYRASPPAYISMFRAFASRETTSASASEENLLVLDDTDRTDQACRYYPITPVTLDDVVLIVQVNFTWAQPPGSFTYISLGRVTFHLTPTNTPVAAP
jgi:hypothetical protein